MFAPSFAHWSVGFSLISSSSLLFPVCLLILLMVVYPKKKSFSKTKQTLIFCAKMIQRIYMKAGEDSREGNVQCHQGPRPMGRRAEGAGDPASTVGAAWVPPHLSLRVLETGRIRLTCAEMFPCLFSFCFVLFWRERSLQGPFPGWGGTKMPSQ